MPRKGWASLSPAYRARLEKAGISKSDYESGQPIQGARGHANTPERPTQAKNFPVYRNARDKLIARVTSKKHAYFSGKPKWNPTRAMKVFKDNPPTMAQLRYWANLTEDEWLDAIREDPNTVQYLGYH